MSYFPLGSVSFVLIRKIYYITLDHYSRSENLLAAWIVDKLNLNLTPYSDEPADAVGMLALPKTPATSLLFIFVGDWLRLWFSIWPESCRTVSNSRSHCCTISLSDILKVFPRNKSKYLA